MRIDGNTRPTLVVSGGHDPFAPGENWATGSDVGTSSYAGANTGSTSQTTGALRRASILGNSCGQSRACVQEPPRSGGRGAMEIAAVIVKLALSNKEALTC